MCGTGTAPASLASQVAPASIVVQVMPVARWNRLTKMLTLQLGSSWYCMRYLFPPGFFARVSVRLSLLIFGVAVLLYAQTVRYDYAWDDAIVITENERVQQGFAGLASHWYKHKSDLLQDQYGYRPVVMTTFGLEYGFFGHNPAIPHLTNTLLYALLCVVIFAVLRRLLPQLGIWVLLAATMLYVLHPLHVEAVANIKSRDELMAFLLALSSLWLLLRYYDSGKIGHLAAAVTAMCLAFLSKESAVAMLPIMGLAILLQPGSLRKKLTLLLPLPLLAAAAFLIYRWADASSVDVALTAGAGIFQEDLGLGNPMLSAPNESMLLSTKVTLPLRYLGEFFWPWPLVYYSGYDHIQLSDWSHPLAGISLSVMGSWTVAALVFLRRDKAPLYALAFFAGYLSLYAHFIRPLADLMADRFMLAPSLGASLLTAWVLARLFGIAMPKTSPTTDSTKSSQPQRHKVIIYLSLMGAFALLMGYRSLDRMPAWKDNLSLFSTDIPQLPGCARCHVHYAGALAQAYQKKGGTAADVDCIVTEYELGIYLSPTVYYGRIELAQFHYSLQQFVEGVAVMAAAVKQFPDQARPSYYLGYGEYFLGKYADAATHLKRSWDLAPTREDAPYYLAWSYYFQGKVPEAIALAEVCIVRYPHNDQFHDALSDFHFGSGDAEQGFAVLKTGIARFQSRLLYRKMVQRCTESGQAELAGTYRQEAQRLGKWE